MSSSAENSKANSRRSISTAAAFLAKNPDPEQSRSTRAISTSATRQTPQLTKDRKSVPRLAISDKSSIEDQKKINSLREEFRHLVAESNRVRKEIERMELRAKRMTDLRDGLKARIEQLDIAADTLEVDLLTIENNTRDYRPARLGTILSHAAELIRAERPPLPNVQQMSLTDEEEEEENTGTNEEDNGNLEHDNEENQLYRSDEEKNQFHQSDDEKNQFHRSDKEEKQQESSEDGSSGSDA